jgi:ATPase subunit of ABC transporter with duplicated ATPase domains
MAMADLGVNNLGVAFDTVLFSDVTFSLSSGERLGVVGNNGSGKTTLLECLAGRQEPTSGSVRPRKGLRTVLVEQHMPDDLADMTFTEVLVSGLSEEDRPALGWRADFVFDSFATPAEMREQPLGKLSGGWQKLAMIGRAWMSDPELVLLDEPTNHLDLSKVMLLEEWVVGQLSRAAVVVVSHDRRFLNNCTTRTLFLRGGNCRAYGYPYSRARELLTNDDRADATKAEREGAKAQRLRESAHKLRQIGVDNYSSAALRKSIQIAKRAAAIQDAIPTIPADPKREIRLQSRQSHANQLITLDGVTIRRPDGSPLFRIDHLEVGRSDRIVLLGRNGTGKTRLVRRLLDGFDDKDTARADGIVISASVMPGYVAQGVDHLPRDVAIRDIVLRLSRSGGPQQATSQLIASGFPFEQHSTTVEQLTPGQRTRLALLCVRLGEPNFFILDEPTNHLDIEGQEQLEATVLDQDSAAVLVSHDRTFAESIGTRFLVIENGGLLELKATDLFYQSLTERVPVAELLK